MWYAEAAIIYKKSSFFSFHSLIFFITGDFKVKFAKCDAGEWNEKYYYPSDILLEGPHG